jgi:DNA-binding SARP family transcriptional activator
MRGLRVLLLGPGRLEFDGQPLTRLMPVKQQALVFFLAAGGEPVARNRLAALLWGETDEAAARANLRAALTRLRRWLPGLLEIDDRQVGFAPGASLAVDWRELAAAMAADADPAAREAASRLWRGPLLDGLDLLGSDAFEHWLAQARQRAQRDAIALRRRLMEAGEAAGAIDTAIAHARGLLEIDDADEPAHMALMRLLAASSRRTAALAQYEACRAALAERLGARPSADCYALYTRIHADAGERSAVALIAPAEAARVPETVTAAGASTTPARSGPSAIAASGPSVVCDMDAAAPPCAPPCAPVAAQGATALVGRGAELALLEQRLADPECRWLTITGPGGVGKTRLAEAAAVRLAPAFRHGAAWFSGRDEGGALRDAETLAQQVLAAIGDDRHARGALLLVLDNLETVAGARALVPLLAARVPGATVLATSRRRLGGPREWLLELGGLALARDADGAPATSPAARLLAARVRRLVPGFDAAAEADAVERISERVGGLPLALEMAAHAVHREGATAVARRLAGQPGEAAALEDPDRDPGDRQHSIAQVLDDAWALLDAPAQRAALRLAALPAAADATLAHAVGVDDAALAMLRDHAWLQRAATDAMAMHPLQQDFLRRRPQAAAESATVRQAMVAHLQTLLPAVEPFGDLPPPARADLLALAARTPALLLSDAVAATGTGGPADAHVQLVDRAVALLAHADRQAEAAALLAAAAERADLPRWQTAGWALRRGELLNGCGASAAAHRAYQQGLALLGLGDFEPDAAAQTLQAAGRIVARRGWPPARHPARRPFERLLLRSLVLFGAMLLFVPNPQPMVRASVLADVVARRSGRRPEREVTRLIQAWGAALFGHPRLARRLAAPLQHRRPLADNPRLELSACQGPAALRLALGEWGGLTTLLDDNAAAWRDWHASRHEMESRSLAAKLAFYEGRLDDAWQRFAALTEASMRRPGDAWRAWGPFGQAEVALCQGRLDGAAIEALYRRGEALLTEMESMDAAYTIRRQGLAARLAWRRGDAAVAREAVLAGCAAAARLRHCGFWAHEGYAGLGDTLVALRAQEAREGGAPALLDRAWSALDAALAAHVRRFPPAQTLHERLAGLHAAAVGDTAGAAARLPRAVALAEASGMRVELARACDALAHTGHGADWVRRAGRLWREMGAPAAPASS